jgi:hypothetical protein
MDPVSPRVVPEIERSPGHGRKLSVDGAERFCTESGEGTPLLLIHGSGPDSRGWSPSFEQLARSPRDRLRPPRLRALLRRSAGRWLVPARRGGRGDHRRARQGPGSGRDRPSHSAGADRVVRPRARAGAASTPPGWRPARRAEVSGLGHVGGREQHLRPSRLPPGAARAAARQRAGHVGRFLAARAPRPLPRSARARPLPRDAARGGHGPAVVQALGTGAGPAAPQGDDQTIASTNHAFTFHQPQRFAPAIRDAAARR